MHVAPNLLTVVELACPAFVTGKTYIGVTDDSAGTVYAYNYADGVDGSLIASKSYTAAGLDGFSGVILFSPPDKVIFDSLHGAVHAIVTWNLTANTFAVNDFHSVVEPAGSLDDPQGYALVGSTIYFFGHKAADTSIVVPYTAAVGASGSGGAGMTPVLGGSASSPNGWTIPSPWVVRGALVVANAITYQGTRTGPTDRGRFAWPDGSAGPVVAGLDPAADFFSAPTVRLADGRAAGLTNTGTILSYVAANGLSHTAQWPTEWPVVGPLYSLSLSSGGDIVAMVGATPAPLSGEWLVRHGALVAQLPADGACSFPAFETEQAAGEDLWAMFPTD